jgi:hypothetical protein
MHHDVKFFHSRSFIHAFQSGTVQVMPTLVLVTMPKQQLRCWLGSKINPTSFAQRVLTARVKFMSADQREQSPLQPVTQPSKH